MTPPEKPAAVGTHLHQSPLHGQLAAAGAEFSPRGDHLLATRFTSVEEEVRAARTTAVVIDRNDRTLLTAEGPDAARFLHGMLSNPVESLEPGTGNYSCHLNAQGHIVADLYLLAMPDHFLIETDCTRVEALRESLEHHIIADRIELSSREGQMSALSVEGPRSDEILKAAGAHPLPGEEFQHSWVDLSGAPALVIRLSETGERGCRLVFTAEAAPGVWQALVKARESVPWQMAGWEAFNVLRTEAGLPWPGAELTDKTLPHEARLVDRAVNYDKGCYLGQEIVERIRSRGNVNRLLCGLQLESSALPEPGAKLVKDGKNAGWITTAVESPTLGRKIALGYLRREYSAEGTELEFEGGTAKVASLPFVPRKS